MFQQDTPIFSFVGPMGVRVEFGSSLIFLALLFVTLADPVNGIVTFAMVFVAIFCHEFGHAWGAKVQGIHVDRVMIYGGGGFCQHATTGPREAELIVAMGPIVNLAFWAIASLAAHYVVATMPLFEGAVDVLPPDLLAQLTWKYQIYGYLVTFSQINLILFILNLVPVQPLDGGKLLHLGLLRFLPALPALKTAGWIGLIFAVLWLPGMLMVYFTFGWMLLFFPPILVHWQMAKGNVPL